MSKLLVPLVAVVLLLAGLVVSLLESSANQPWGQTLGDNFMFARSLPFTLGLGVALGYARSLWPGTTDLKRRFAPSTIWLHWFATLAVLLGLATGGWQYLKGLLDVPSPISMALVYRVHYLAASLLLLVVSVCVTDWWLRGESALGVPRGSRIRGLRGLAHELPRWLGGTIAYLLGLDMRRTPPPAEGFTWYERLVSFPTWVLALALITVTGILKAMRYVFPIPGDVLYWVSAIHVGAMVLLAIKVLDHLRYVLAPSRWRMMRAMLGGSIEPAPPPQGPQPVVSDAPAPSRPAVGGPA
jgi:Prokaryotic cytochrome b561